jgi:hypothetical protein
MPDFSKMQLMSEDLRNHPTTGQLKALKKPKKTVLQKKGDIAFFKIEVETLD